MYETKDFTKAKALGWMGKTQEFQHSIFGPMMFPCRVDRSDVEKRISISTDITWIKDYPITGNEALLINAPEYSNRVYSQKMT